MSGRCKRSTPYEVLRHAARSATAASSPKSRTTAQGSWRILRTFAHAPSLVEATRPAAGARPQPTGSRLPPAAGTTRGSAPELASLDGISGTVRRAGARAELAGERDVRLDDCARGDQAWPTIGLAIVNEVYRPTTGAPQIRDLGFIVAVDDEWFEVKRVNLYSEDLALGAHPRSARRSTRATATRSRRFPARSAPRRAADLVRAGRSRVPSGSAGRSLSLRDRVGQHGWWEGRSAARARSSVECLCLMAEQGFIRASTGYVGASDGWQDFNTNGRLTWEFARATNGNVALIGELDDQSGVLALGFGESPTGARTLATSSLVEGAATVRKRFIGGWTRWHQRIQVPATPDKELERHAWGSAVVLKAHQDRTYPGATVACLSIPWAHRTSTRWAYHSLGECDTGRGRACTVCATDQTARCRCAPAASRRRARMGTGRRTSSRTAARTGPASSGRNRLPDRVRGNARELGLPERPSVAPIVRRAASYLARTVRKAHRIGGRRIPARAPSRSASRSLPSSPRPNVSSTATTAVRVRVADCWNERIAQWTYGEGGDLVSRSTPSTAYTCGSGPARSPPGAPPGLVEVPNSFSDETVAARAVTSGSCSASRPARAPRGPRPESSRHRHGQAMDLAHWDAERRRPTTASPMTATASIQTVAHSTASDRARLPRPPASRGHGELHAETRSAPAIDHDDANDRARRSDAGTGAGQDPILARFLDPLREWKRMPLVWAQL